MEKRITFLFCLITVSVTIIFLWSGKLALNDSHFAKINSYFQIIGSIATALVIFLMYKQIQLQNYESTADFEPNIHFENMELQCKFSRGEETGVKGLIQITTSFNIKENSQPTNSLSFINNGNNTAFDIKIQWRKKVFDNLLEYQFSKEVSGQYYFKSLDKDQIESVQFPIFISTFLSIAKTMIDNSKARQIFEKSYFLKLEFRDRRKLIFSKNIPVEFILSGESEFHLAMKFEN